MFTNVNTNRQTYRSGWETTAPTTGLYRVFGIDRNNLNCGTFSLHFQDIKESRPTRIIRGLGKTERPYNAFDIQTGGTLSAAFVNNHAVAVNQRFSRFVVEIFALVCNVCVNFCKGFDCFLSVCTAAFFTGNGTLGAAKFGLRFPIEFRCIKGFTFAGNKERFQTEVNADRRIFRRFANSLLDFANKDNIPPPRMTLACRGFDCPFDSAVQFEFNIANVLEACFAVFSKFCPVIDCKINAVKATIATESWITRLVSLFDAAKEGLESAVKTFQGSLARGKVSKCEVRIDFPFRFDFCRLSPIGDGSLLCLVNAFSFGKGIVVKAAMRFQKACHSFLLCLVRVSAETKSPRAKVPFDGGVHLRPDAKYG